ncbi:MAG: DEAD/DEAH box helicase [Methanobrevibacter sp. CfCl-M3]
MLAKLIFDDIMSKNSYNYLSKTMKEFLFSLGWKKLNSIQNEAIPLIMDDKDTLIISPTASGKTEAVLIPVFEKISKERLKPMSVLYVAPLKALINDIYNRVETWGNYFGLTTTKWHGDVNKSQKDNFINNPTDFLIITPESLEVILMNRNLESKKRIFQNIKFVIIDEIHYFADSDRGIQLNSILNRISKYTNNKTTKIGLSATIGNPDDVAKWINHKNPPTVIVNMDEDRKSFYKLHYDKEENIFKYLKRYIDKKILIFVLSRSNAEKTHNILKRTIKNHNILLHHSSISKIRREEAEENFEKSKNGFMISTSTLELGIDIGDITIVVQIKSPKNVSSFLQRVGRSGRQTKIQRSIIITDLWDTLFTFAQISLINENTIEELIIPTSSKDIYFHQILSSVFEVKKIETKDLYLYLKDAYVFSDITKEDYKIIIKDMVERNFLELNNGFLSLGYEFEQKFGKKNYMEFFTVFCPSYDFRVKEGKKDVGNLEPSMAIQLKSGDNFILSGSHWNVLHIDYKRFVVQVKKNLNHTGSIPSWKGDGIPVSGIISRKVYEIICGEYISSLLRRTFDDKSVEVIFDDKSVEVINNVIKNAKESGFEKRVIPVEIDNNMKKVVIYTFAGFKANTLLSTIFKLYYDIYGVKDTQFYSSFKIKEDSIDNITFSDIEKVMYSIEELLKNEETIESIGEIVGKFYKNKFINYLPYKDQLSLKMDIIFDKKSLINCVKNNTFVEVFNVNFDRWIEGGYKRSDNFENNTDIPVSADDLSMKNDADVSFISDSANDLDIKVSDDVNISDAVDIGRDGNDDIVGVSVDMPKYSEIENVDDSESDVDIPVSVDDFDMRDSADDIVGISVDIPDYSGIEGICDSYGISMFNEIIPTSTTCSSLSEAIQEILSNEHPVHITHLSKLLLSYLNQRRVTDGIRNQIVLEIEENELGKIRGEFVYLDASNMPLTTDLTITPRIPNNRPIDHISTSELMKGMFIIVDKSFTHTKESLFNETGKLFGFKHLDDKIFKALDDTFKELLNNNRLIFEDGIIKTNSLKIYQDKVNELKRVYENKEKIICDRIKNYFSPEEKMYGRFIDELNGLSETILREIDSSLSFINMAPGHTKNIVDETEKKVNTIKSSIDNMDNFTTEIETVHKYDKVIQNLKIKYQNKEKITHSRIKNYFSPEEKVYDRFIAEFNSLSETILREIDSSLSFINMEIGNTNSVVGEIEERINTIKSSIDNINDLTVELETVHKYEKIILDLKLKYQEKEDISRKLIKERFPPPQITYDRFMDEIDGCNEKFYTLLELTSDIIDMAPGLTNKALNELKEKVETLTSIKEEIENLVVELTINSNNSSDISDDEVKNLLDDMRRLNSSVKEYK